MTTPERPGVRYAREVGPGDAGVRVTLRHRTSDGRHTDVIGRLEGWDETVRVRDRHDVLHTVAAADVVAARRVPPPPERR